MAKTVVSEEERTIVIDHGYGVKDTTTYSRFGWLLHSWGGGASLDGEEKASGPSDQGLGQREGPEEEVREVCAKCGQPNIWGQGSLARLPLWGSKFDGVLLCTPCWNEESREYDQRRDSHSFVSRTI